MSLAWHISPDADSASLACARRVLELLKQRIAGANIASIAISGGSSPKRMFAEMAASSLDWTKVHIFWVDERGVPPTDSQSNFRMANEFLLQPARIPVENIHRVRAELPPQEAAALYAEDIRAFFHQADGAMPEFDVIHRGMGPDAHTASLFPGEPLIDDRTGVAAAVYVEKFQQWRITLLPGVLLAARNTVMLVAGADKAEPLHTVLEGPPDPKRFPAQVTTDSFNPVTWFLDEAAAALIH